MGHSLDNRHLNNSVKKSECQEGYKGKRKKRLDKKQTEYLTDILKQNQLNITLVCKN